MSLWGLDEPLGSCVRLQFFKLKCCSDTSCELSNTICGCEVTNIIASFCARNPYRPRKMFMNDF